MIKGYIFLILLLVSGAVSPSYAETFDELKGSLMQLSQKEKGITRKIDSLRNVASQDPSQIDKCGGEIVNLEGSLYELRGSMAAIATKLALIEQTEIIESGSTIASTSKEDEIDNSAIANLYDAPQVSSLATKSELSIISQKDNTEERADKIFASLKKASIGLDSLIATYENTSDKVLGDSLERKYNLFCDSLSTIDRESTSEWQEIFSTKQYLYDRVLDNINADDEKVSKLISQAGKVRSESIKLKQNSFTPNLSLYMRQKGLIFEYESLLSELLGATSLSAKIAKQQESFDVTKYDLTRKILVKKHMIEYTPITRTTAKAHSASNPPKQLDVPSKGELYKVQLGIYSKEITNYALFYRIAPVEYAKLPTGKYCYWAGSYHTFKEADAASKTLNRAGLHTYVAEWKDGVNPKMPELNSGEYRIRLGNITPEMKKIIDAEAPDMQISRSTDINGKSSYYLGVFEIRAEAERLIELLGKGTSLVVVE